MPTDPKKPRQPVPPAEVDMLLRGLRSARTPVATTAERQAHRASVEARRGGAGRPVLVVDSTPIARSFLMQRLQALGYDVHGADDGEQAVAMIEERAFAVVFTELALAPRSGIDGLALCRAIRDKPDHPNGIAPAIVVVTGRSDASDRIAALRAGCDAYLTKPLVDSEFVAALHEADPLFQ